MKNFITIEGCEGVGKSTQIRLLQEYFKKNRADVLFTREPGGSKIAESIRNIILYQTGENMSDVTEAMLFAAARAQHVQEIVAPALRLGKLVFCDRFVDSSYAYQGFARGLGYEFVQRLNALAVGEYMPQYTVFLDLSPQKAFQRKGGADQTDRLELQDLSFHQKVYEGYLEVMRQNPERFLRIDAGGSMDETFAKIISELKKRNVIS